MKKHENWKISKIKKLIENINVSFLVSNNIVFCSRKNHTLEKWCRNYEKRNCPKMLKNEKEIIEIRKNQNVSVKNIVVEYVYLQKSLRVLPAETRLTVYRRPRVFLVRKVKFWNMFDHLFSTSIIFPQAEWCQQACVLNEKCSRRNDKSKNPRLRPQK